MFKGPPDFTSDEEVQRYLDALEAKPKPDDTEQRILRAYANYRPGSRKAKRVSPVFNPQALQKLLHTLKIGNLTPQDLKDLLDGGTP